MIFVGIDPAFRENGFAICIIDEDNTIFFKVFSDGIISYTNWLYQDAPEKAAFCIENSNLQNELFDKTGSVSVQIKKALDVGKNMGISQATVNVTKSKYPKTTYDISPKKKGKKWSDMIFRAVCKDERHAIPKDYMGGDADQDKRDAYALALAAKKLYRYGRI